MNASTSPHPTDQALQSYSLGKLDDASARVVGDHLEGCPGCRSRAAETTSDTFLGRLREIHNPSAGMIPGGSPDAAPIGLLQAKAPSPFPSADTLPPGLADHHDYQIRR